MLLKNQFRLILAVVSGIILSISLNAKPALSVDDFLADPNVYDAEFSPDGRYLALIVNKQGFRQLIIRDFDKKGFPVSGAMSDKIFRPTSLNWANDERLIVNLLIPGGERIKRIREKANTDPDFDITEYPMFRRSVSVDANAKDLVVLMENKYRLRSNRNLSGITNFLPNDDQHVIIPALGERALEAYKVNIYTGKAERIAKGVWRTFQFLTDDDGRPLYRLDYLYYGKIIKVHRYTDDADWELIDKIYLNQEDEESIETTGLYRLSIGDDLELTYRERNSQTGFYEIVKRSSDGNLNEVVASLPGKDIYAPITDATTNRYIGYKVQEDLIRSHFNDKALQEHHDKIADQVGHSNFNVSLDPQNSKRTVVFSYGLDNPGTYYLYDYKTYKLSFLAQKYSKLPKEKLAIPAQATYKARDGQKIRVYVFFPPDYQQGERYPLVVNPHGGPHLRDSAGYDDFAQFMATRGYIVIQPNFRGSTGYGKKFEEAGYGQWGGVMQDDLTDAVSYMVKKGYADAKRVCIVGGSYGGYAALMGAIKTPDLYRCSISMNGVTNLKDQIEHFIDKARTDEEGVEKRLHKKIGHPEKDSKLLDRNSPVFHAYKIKIPLLIIAGEDDDRVPAEQSEDMVDALEGQNKDVRYVEIEDAGHNLFRYSDDMEKVYQEVDKFLAKHLK